jgi:WhiB family redox-sensing transcriptional regulator
MDSALCSQVDADLWFPSGFGITPRQMEAKAKSVCANCPVSRPCLEMALADPHIEGVWGGTSDKDRRRIRKGLAA